MSQPQTGNDEAGQLPSRFAYTDPRELQLVSRGDPDAEPIDFSPLPSDEESAAGA